LIVINEVESNDASNGPDWVELYNLSADKTIDVTGWIFKDDTPSHNYSIVGPAAIAPHGYFAFDGFNSGTGNFGLGSKDEAHLYDPTGTTQFDSYMWATHALQTYGRCPDGTGNFVDTVAPTRGAANSCPP
jgi:hypothetical protein